MMKRRLSFKQVIEQYACDEGFEWAQSQPDLRTAWARCPKGSWMAWWLEHYRGVPGLVLRAIAWSITNSSYATDYYRTGAFFSHEQDQAYADRLREIFTPSGAFRR